MDMVRHLDEALLLGLNQFAGHSVALDAAVRGVVNIYLVKLGPFCTALWWLWFREDSRNSNPQDGQRRIVVDIIAGAALAVLLTIVIQTIMPERPRPLHDPSIAFVVPLGHDPGALKNWSSFPSDNAAIAFALAAGFFRVSRLMGVLACLWAAVVICVPRVYLGLHFPSDVTAGALIGIASATLVTRLSLPSALYRLVWSVEANHRPWFYSGAFLVTYEMVTLFESIRRVAGGAAKILKGLGSLP